VSVWQENIAIGEQSWANAILKTNRWRTVDKLMRVRGTMRSFDS